MRYGKRLNRQEKREMQHEKLKNSMSGTGIYVYENNSDADLSLPKPTESGVRVIGPRKRFQGDSYFMSWVGSPMNLLKLVEVVVPQLTVEQIIKQKEENAMVEQKLILDQPDTITHGGKVEYVVGDDPTVKQLNDNAEPAKKMPEVLLTEDPLDGVEIILG